MPESAFSYSPTVPTPLTSNEMHSDLGPVRLQVNTASKGVYHKPARFVDAHPLDVVEQQLGELHDAVRAIFWDDGQPTEFDSSSPLVT